MASSIDLQRKNLDAISLNAKILKPLDEILRCHICFDYFTNCMITKCSHNYCSVCIRRYMSYKSQCPTCFQVATEPELQNNRLIDEILRIYKNIRETIQIPADSKFPTDASSSSRSLCSDNFEKPTVCEELSQKGSKPQNAEESTSDEVSCPVCYTTVPSRQINIHLDRCLKQNDERNKRKFLPKLVYHLLPDKEIRKKLKEHGLSTNGNRQALIRRHKNFVILFNANCDSLNPKPVSELICDIERQEIEERIHASQRTAQVNKKSDPSIIEKEHESYVQEHKSQFNALIRDVQQRVPVQKVIKTESGASEEHTDITDASGKVIGKSIFSVGRSSDVDSLYIKEEFSESLLEETTSKLPFRIKKDVPTVKIKEEPTSFLDITTNQGFESDGSSLDDFETGKMSVNTYPKKKNARRLSTEEKSSQRKK